MSEGTAGERPDEVIRTIRLVSETMETVSQSLKSIEKFGRRTRQISIALIISLVLDLALTSVVGLLSANAVSQSNAVRSVQYSECLIANQTKIDQINLWNYLINLSSASANAPAAHLTPEQKAANQRELQQLRNYVMNTFKPLTCNP